MNWSTESGVWARAEHASRRQVATRADLVFKRLLSFESKKLAELCSAGRARRPSLHKLLGHGIRVHAVEGMDAFLSSFTLKRPR